MRNPFRPATLAVLLVPALALAGCVATPEEGVEAAAVAPGADDAAGADLANATATPFTFDGSVPAHAGACAWAVVAGQCAFTPSLTEWRSAVEPDYEGEATTVRVTATWDATSPVTEEMVLFAGAWDRNTGEWEDFGYEMGASPIEWEVDVDVPKGFDLLVGLVPPGQGMGALVGGAWARANPTDQPFTLEGEVVALAPAAT